MKSNKVMFWFGLAMNLMGTFGLFGHVVGGDSVLLAGVAIMVFSFSFELLTLYFICAAFFWYQEFMQDIWIIAILGVSACISAILALFNK